LGGGKWWGGFSWKKDLSGLEKIRKLAMLAFSNVSDACLLGKKNQGITPPSCAEETLGPN